MTTKSKKPSKKKTKKRCEHAWNYWRSDVWGPFTSRSCSQCGKKEQVLI